MIDKRYNTGISQKQVFQLIQKHKKCSGCPFHMIHIDTRFSDISENTDIETRISLKRVAAFHNKSDLLPGNKRCHGHHLGRTLLVTPIDKCKHKRHVFIEAGGLKYAGCL